MAALRAAYSASSTMSKERAILWMCVMILIALGFITGQVMSTSVAAMAAAVLAYEGIKARNAA